MAVHNEEMVLEQKIASIMQTNYPHNKFEVIVGSDCSTDKTNTILQQAANTYPNLRFTVFDKRQGKIAIINELVDSAAGDILISTDANVLFNHSTIYELVKHFEDTSIGLVDSKMVNKGLKKTGISIQESTYITQEVMIKHREGKIWGAMIGPFGGCYAIRKELFAKPPVNFLVDDFYINMKVLEKGKKCINSLNALAIEDVSNNISQEFKRKTRIATGNFQNLKEFRHLLWPIYTPIAFAFLSHKVIRWFGPILMLCIFAISIILSFSVFSFKVLALMQLGIFLLPLIDIFLKSINIHVLPLRFATHFLITNFALLIGLIKYLKGVQNNVWQPTQRNQ
ncbi:glycosyl transferase [Tenuifilaceae bacterium CYCD]|nr:glycosyl transferase [Tenuifilaceae bacterium CYCD]